VQVLDYFDVEIKVFANIKGGVGNYILKSLLPLLWQ
jgi:hypothetical protein